MLETVFPVPVQEMRMGAIGKSCWWVSPTAFVYEGTNAVDVIYLARHQYFEVVGKTDQATIEHPMRSPGKRNAVINNIRTVVFDRPNMGSINFGPAAAVDQL
ncbi:hypothetical protein Rvan_3156 [Rhodomicrobium vannielii ATCC 17100]|uniref:Uncharacterized protein n=1 Tax=Rhodomicrobium vannielii (strain ATCC 17100 / DSM 162 / LMG 4299 / NCIMB 10020 / ATH 3.1.1) TaxID=648757 RepID=E3I132_RHOVT|nr:hypothetical protein Rvan_3156 [Rhodomicrobium vannielii ATCC 17100]